MVTKVAVQCRSLSAVTVAAVRNVSLRHGPYSGPDSRYIYYLLSTQDIIHSDPGCCCCVLQWQIAVEWVLLIVMQCY